MALQNLNITLFMVTNLCQNMRFIVQIIMYILIVVYNVSFHLSTFIYQSKSKQSNSLVKQGNIAICRGNTELYI